MRQPLLLAAALSFALAGCQTPEGAGSFGVRPVIGNATPISARLAELPPPPRQVTVAVYDFPDLTGANKPNDRYADYSKAITQGAASIAIDALKSAGGGAWFKVVERNRLDDLLRERKLITATYSALGQDWRTVIRSLKFADYIVTGGIVSYDAGITAGGVGATYLGLGGTVNYRRDLVSINLRLVSVTDGSVVRSITSSRVVYSVTPALNVTRYVSFGDLLSVQAGVTSSEATQVAVREAIEAAVYELIREGEASGLWAANPKDGEAESLPALRASPPLEYVMPPEYPAERSAERPPREPPPRKILPGDPLFHLRGGRT
ncbi:MAG TPA: CsgG/HfaB family protein [Beijerinckiaceae bacterium]|jgi:curli production assembly/transport component CsgG